MPWGLAGRVSSQYRVGLSLVVLTFLILWEGWEMRGLRGVYMAAWGRGGVGTGRGRGKDTGSAVGEGEGRGLAFPGEGGIGAPFCQFELEGGRGNIAGGRFLVRGRESERGAGRMDY